MRLEIENINKIKKATIQMNGLTVIVGENSTGKSTVGRILFSTIKALANTINTDEKSKEFQLRKIIHSMFLRLKNLESINFNDAEVKSLFQVLTPEAFWKDLNQTENIDNFIAERIDFIDKLNIPPRQKELIKEDLSNVKYMMVENIEARLSLEIRSLIESEFLNKVCSNKSDSGTVKFIADDISSYLTYNVKKNNNDVEIRSYSMGNDFFRDVTYIESPLYLHMHDVLKRAVVYRESMQSRNSLFSMIPLHIKDCADKMDYLKYSFPLNNETIELSDIINGKFHYDEHSRSIVFADNNGEYFPINVASGIKSFGVLQILLDGGLIGPNKILIWDEPENHLHPQWQIEFAKVFVLLAKSGIPILVSTHSPYFLQAIRFYSVKYSIDDYVNMYLADIKDDGMAMIDDVTDDLSPVFMKLAAPLNDIMNVDSQRKKTTK